MPTAPGFRSSTTTADCSSSPRTGERVVRVEERQITLAEGPCHTAFETGKPVVAENLDHEDRWPAYTPEARRVGCRAVLGLPMHVDDERVGAVNVYFLDPREWSEDEIEAGQVLAAIATGYIRNVRRLAETLDLAEQLQHALDSHEHRTRHRPEEKVWTRRKESGLLPPRQYLCAAYATTAGLYVGCGHAPVAQLDRAADF